MRCPYCLIDQTIKFFDRDNPILSCGHGVYPEGSDERLAEDVCASAEQETQDLATTRGVSYEEAQRLIIREGIASLPTKKKIGLLRTLHDAKITSPDIREAEQALSKPSLRFVRRG